MIERVTQQWPKQKTRCFLVERTASTWVPRPKTCGPLPDANVSSRAILMGNRSGTSARTRRAMRCPRWSGSQAPREKKRWKRSQCTRSATAVATSAWVTV
jgi:hypothetical protein